MTGRGTKAAALEEAVMELDVLAFGAHADDVELACGGTLARLAALGHTTGVTVLTRGEMGTRGNAAIRAKEFSAAARVLGLAVHSMLDIPDGRVEVTWANKLKVIRELRARRPKIVFAPHWVARHPDHEQTSHLVRQASYLAGLVKVETGQPPFRPLRVLYYPSGFEFSPSFIVDVSGSHEQKMRAIRAYRSQFSSRTRGAAENDGTLIGRPDFLESVETRDKHFGGYIGVKYGEPFLVREAIKIEDPVTLFGPESLWARS